MRIKYRVRVIGEVTGCATLPDDELREMSEEQLSDCLELHAESRVDGIDITELDTANLAIKTDDGYRSVSLREILETNR